MKRYIKSSSQQIYYLVEHDRGGHVPEVIETFTNKNNAIKKCRELRNLKDAKNSLRYSEHSNERTTECWSVTTTDDFSDDSIHGRIF